MFVTRTVFTVQFKDIGKAAKLEAVDVLASNMEVAIDIVRRAHNRPRITLVQDRGQSILVEEVS